MPEILPASFKFSGLYLFNFSRISLDKEGILLKSILGKFTFKFIAPIGLSKVTELSPKKATAFFMGLWFLSSTVAHYIAGALAKLTIGGTTTDSTGLLGKLNSMLFTGVYPNGVGVAEAMVYNDLFGKIGFVTIGIALITLNISQIIKKYNLHLMKMLE